MDFLKFRPSTGVGTGFIVYSFVVILIDSGLFRLSRELAGIIIGVMVI